MKAFECFAELFNSLKIFIDACESNIGNVIKTAQMFKNDIAKIFRFDLKAACGTKLGFNVVNNFRFLFVRDIWTFGARDANTAIKLLAIKNLRRTIRFHNDNRVIAEAFIGRKTVSAFQAFTTTANRVELIGRTRINDFRFGVATNGAAHMPSNHTHLAQSEASVRVDNMRFMIHA